MKKFMAMSLVLLMVLSLVGCGGGSSASNASKKLDTDNPVYIGVLDAFTGDKAMSGMYAKEGADMFVDYINANGGVLGRQLIVEYEDDQGNETVGTNAYQKITSQYELSGTVLSKYSSVTLAIEPFVAEQKIPAICTGSSVKIASSTNSYLYSMRKSDTGSGATLANACAEILKSKKVAVLHSPDALGTGMSPVVESGLKAKGIEVVSVQQFTADDKNFAPYIAKIKESGCDTVVGIAQQTEAALIMKAVKDASLNVQCIGNSAFCQQTAIQNAGDACNGWYSVTAWSPTVSTEPAQSWIKDYKERYNKDPDMSSALTYDALAVFCKAMEDCKSTDPAEVNKALQNIKDYQGLGSKYSFQSGTRMMATSEYITKVTDGKSIIQNTIYS